MDNKFTVVCLEPGFAPVMFHHDTMEAAQACLTACKADGCTAKLATDADDAARIWNEMQTQAVAALNQYRYYRRLLLVGLVTLRCGRSGATYKGEYDAVRRRRLLDAAYVRRAYYGRA